MSLGYSHEQVAAIIATQQSRPGALLPILHDIQHALGFIPPDSVAQIASALNLSRAEVHGVITFYHHFRTTPPARHTIQICCAGSMPEHGGGAVGRTRAAKIGRPQAGGICIAAGLLPGSMCELAGCDDRRGVARARHAGKIRCADKEYWAQEYREQAMSIKIFVPRDSVALALGADAVAKAILDEAARRNIDVSLVRNGSRGMLWLEPLVEVQTAKGRVAYGPVSPEDVSALFDSRFHDGGKHALGFGLTEEIPYLKRQERLTFARVGITDPLSLEDYLAHDGFKGLRKALTMRAAAIVQQVTDSGLRGRGGAAIPDGHQMADGVEYSGGKKIHSVQCG